MSSRRPATPAGRGRCRRCCWWARASRPASCSARWPATPGSARRRAASAQRLQSGQMRGSLLVTVLVGIGITYYFYTQSRSAYLVRKMREARQHATEARLKLLESQLEPHMLFNTLANLRVLIAHRPGARAGHARPADRLPARHARRLAQRPRMRWRPSSTALADYLALMARAHGAAAADRARAARCAARLPGAAAAAAAAGGEQHPPRPRAEGARAGASTVSARARRRRAGADACATPASACAGSAAAPRHALRPAAGARAAGARCTATRATLALRAPRADGGTLARITLPLQTAP